VTQDPVDDRPLVDRRDEPHPPATAGAGEHVDAKGGASRLPPTQARLR
jgi:hypothetical protein